MTCTSRASTTFRSSPRRDARLARADGRLVVLGGIALATSIARRSGRGRAAAAGPRAARRPGRSSRSATSSAVVVRRGQRRSAVAVAASPARTSATSGTTAARAGNEAHCGAGAAVGREREAADRRPVPPPCGRVGVDAPPSRQRPPALGEAAAKRSLARDARRSSRRTPSAPSANRSRSGCSNTNQRSSAAPLDEDAGRAQSTSAGSISKRGSRAPAGHCVRPPDRFLDTLAEPAQRLLGQRRCLSPATGSGLARPREIAISPVRIISISPNGRTMFSNASILSVVPVISIDHRALRDVDDLAAEDLRDLHQLARARPSAETLNSASSRATVSCGSRSRILSTLTSLCSCLVTWSIGCAAPSSRQRHARDRLVVGRPDRERVDVEARAARTGRRSRVSTPGLFSTRIESTCLRPVRMLPAASSSSSRRTSFVPGSPMPAHHVPRGGPAGIIG